MHSIKKAEDFCRCWFCVCAAILLFFIFVFYFVDFYILETTLYTIDASNFLTAQIDATSHNVTN